MHVLLRASIPSLLAVAMLARSTAAQCPAWQPGFELPGTQYPVATLAVFDDGAGPALYAGGGYTLLGGEQVSGVARWDGSTWSAVGSGVPNAYALLAFDDGSGAALYAGGGSGLHRWDGASWTSIDAVGDGAIVCLAAFDDGSGPALYAGGTFTSIGGVAASRIARWDGGVWSALGSGTDAGVLFANGFE